MNTSPLPFYIARSVEHHMTAAKHHEDAAQCHRNAAANYDYGDYQKVNEHARSAREFGLQAATYCARAMD